MQVDKERFAKGNRVKEKRRDFPFQMVGETQASPNKTGGLSREGAHVNPLDFYNFSLTRFFFNSLLLEGNSNRKRMSSVTISLYVLLAAV